MNDFIALLYIAVIVTHTEDPSSMVLPLLVSQMPEKTLHTITGNLLGDGC